MYNFYCNPNLPTKTKLLFVKHLLPRYLNGIPDAEFTALLDCNKYLDNNKVIIETGCGASTIALMYLAALTNCIYINWDPSELKQNEIKNVVIGIINSGILPVVFATKMLMDSVFVSATSDDDHLGILAFSKERDLDICMAFLDGYHSIRNVKYEVKCILSAKHHPNDVVIAIDDADLRYEHTNTGLINIQRKKLRLSPIEIEQDTSKTFGDAVKDELSIFINDTVLNGKPQWSYRVLTEIVKQYNKDIVDDETSMYYSTDKAAMITNGLEDANKNLNRFLPILLEKT